jgi:hypothetical protein
VNLRLLRKIFTPESTIGVLSVNGKPECFTLEDRVRAAKVPGKTAIPAGIYEVSINFSDRFQRPLPLLLYVPGFSGIRIHPGNTAADTDGCILVGRTRGVNAVLNSRAAFQALFGKLQAAARREKIFLEVAGSPAGSQQYRG